MPGSLRTVRVLTRTRITGWSLRESGSKRCCVAECQVPGWSDGSNGVPFFNTP